jgi:ABC-type multidrug transport system permease subunit
VFGVLVKTSPTINSSIVAFVVQKIIIGIFEAES